MICSCRYCTAPFEHEVCGTERDTEQLEADLDFVIKERDEALAEIERLRKTANTAPEPSRLEIAARSMQAFISSGAFVIDIPEQALAYADALILRANYK
jgi:hypothetical protein